MKALKILGLAVAALFALLLVAVLAIALLFDPNDYKPELQQAVERRTGRALQLPGRLELTWFPWLAIEAGPAALANAPGFGAEPLLEIGRLRLGVRVSGLLLGRRLELDTIRLEQPVLRLATAADGRDNWSDLVDRLTGTEAATPPGAAPRFEASVSGLQVADGRVEIRDARDASRIEVAALAIETGALRPGAPFDLDSQFTVRSGPGTALETRIEGRATLDLDASRARLEQPAIALRLRGAGWPRDGLPLSLRSGPIELDLEAQRLALPRFVLESLGARLTGELTGTRIVDAPRFSGPVRLEPASLRDWARQAGIDLPAMRDPQALAAVSFDAELDATPRSVALEKLRMKLDGASLQGGLGIPDLDAENLPLRFELEADRLDLDRYLAPEDAGSGTAAGAARSGESAPAGAASGAPAAASGGAARAPAGQSTPASAPFELPVELLRTLDLVGQLRAGRATLAGVSIAPLRLGIDARAARLRIEPLEAGLYGGQLRGTLRIDAGAAVPRLEFDQAVTDIDFGALLAGMLDSRRFSGRGKGSFTGSARGTDVDAWLRSANGRGSFEIADGALEGADLWYEIRRARAVLRQEAAPSRPPGAPRTPFTRLRGTAQVESGALRSDDLAIDLQYLRVAGRGRLDLASKALDGKLDATVLKIPADAADMREAVDFTVPVKVSGTLDEPVLRPDVAGLAKARLKQEVEKHRDEIDAKRGELEQKVRDRLKDLFKR